MALIQWAATASQGAWTDAIPAASFNTQANVNNGAIVVGSAIDNTTTVDMLAEVSFISTATAITSTAGAHLAVYLLPLLHNDTTYPTNNASGTSLPAITYCRGIIGMPVGSIVPAGSTIISIPYGTWKFGLVNRLGVNFSASATALTFRYRLLVESIA